MSKQPPLPSRTSPVFPSSGRIPAAEDSSSFQTLTHENPSFPFTAYLHDLCSMDQGQIPWHCHPDFEISMAESDAFYQISTARILLHAGDFIFINSGVIHNYRCVSGDSRCSIRGFAFAPEFIAEKKSQIYHSFVSPLLHGEISHCIVRTSHPAYDRCISQISRCLSYAENTDEMKMLRIHSSLLNFWQCFFPVIYEGLQKNQKHHPAAGDTARIQMMLRYIHQNFNRKILLAEIADAAQISEREALRCFSSHLGKSPIQYLNEYRLKNAEQMLRKDSCPVTTIALECGFNDIGYFCKAFRNRFGLTPTEYRRLFISP